MQQQIRMSREATEVALKAIYENYEIQVVCSIRQRKQMRHKWLIMLGSKLPNVLVLHRMRLFLLLEVVKAII